MDFLRWLTIMAMLLSGFAHGQWDFTSLTHSPAAAETKTPTLRVSAGSSVLSYKPGESFFIAIQCDIDAPWHAYFRNPATVGEAMSVELDAPAGFRVEGPYWQVPQREKGAIGVSYAYSGESPLVVWKLTPAADAPDKAKFSIEATAQLCHDEGCTPPKKVSDTLLMEKGAGEAAPQWGDKQKQAEVLGDSPIAVSATQTAEAVQLSFSSPGEISQAYFFSDDNAIDPTAEQILEKTSNGYLLTMPRNSGKDLMYPVKDETMIGKELSSLHGILAWDGGFRSINIPFLQKEALPHGKAAGIPSGFLGVIGSLFLGGLILNLMPCVFPVIGLKIMGFVELGGGERHKVFLHSLVFVIGILISFWALSLLLVILSNLDTLAHVPWSQWAATLWHDAGSDSRSWAVWMQNEWMVYGILLLLLTLGLSMFGVFDIGVTATGAGQNLQNKKGLWGSFFQGLLVTLVATPCSAPILGAAMPAAMSMPGMWMVAALTFMALGLAFPYIVLGAFPGLLRLLPRPGAWMESLKQGLSFLLFAAAAWMLDVYLSFLPDSQSPNVPWMLMSLVVFCSAFWVYGRWCPISRSRASRTWGFLAALLLAAWGIWGSMPQGEGSQCAPLPASSGYIAAQGTHPVWNTWSKEAMDKALADGHPVFVDFTAKWCATCQSNKMLGYSDAVYDEFAKAGAVLMRADKTRTNEAIDAEMRRLNRSSVPVNALYIPGKQPAITREVFTSSYLLDFLKTHLQEPSSPSSDEEDEAQGGN